MKISQIIYNFTKPKKTQMDMLEFFFFLFFFAIIISWVSVFIISIIQPDRFKKDNDDNDRQDWEQGWPF